MGKEAEDRSTNIQMSPTSQKVIEGSNYQKNCLKIITEKGVNIDITEENSSSCSITSFSSSDLMEDAISSSSTSSSSNGPLFQLSHLMDQLPIKRGLSKYYQGKSQSFTSLTSVVSLEDLPKKENPYNYNKRIKSLCRSSCRGFDTRKLCSPKPAISKTNSRISSFPSLPKTSCSNNLIISSCRPPHSLPPLHKHF